MWNSEWKAISSRIAGIVDASAFLFRNSLADKRGHGKSTQVLIRNCDETAKSTIDLQRYGESLPMKANEALRRFESVWSTAFWGARGPSHQPGLEFQLLEERVVLLASIRSELDHLLADQNAIIRSHVKRAFQHLDRSLVADSELRQKWLRAFSEGETACEKLGAAHMLLHGIWAFKANSARQRTDLVLGNTLDVDDEVIGAARGLVLTEWKLVRREDKPEEVRKIAKAQASLYAGGGLAGFELESERYLVLIAEQEFDAPKDENEGSVSYKVISLVLNRKTPSDAAKQEK
jgi:hypothetical protein